MEKILNKYSSTPLDEAKVEETEEESEQRGRLMLSVEDVSFQYPAPEDRPAQCVLNHVNLKVQDGEFVALLGHNGSGKSTLARLLNAQFLPTEGRIRILGMDTGEERNLWKIRAHCGMVFQNPDNQLVASIVEEDVAFGPENLGIPNPELRERVEEALDIVGMLDYKRREPHRLSGGQKQRVAIAGILAMHPECLIMDEPTAMLDPQGRKEIIETIEHLHKVEKKTILLITHYMEEAVNADRVIVLNDGRIVLEGTPREVFSQVERMRELELDVPQVTELSHMLNQAGFRVPDGILTIEEMVEVLQ